MKFTYRFGQRPLDGFTLKRGLGKGGFGEVYLAVSDGGKHAAIKLIRGHGDIELRGITNCMNLKHPNLVHIYDLRTDAQGDRWLVMEYVQGESLAATLGKHPDGLPESQARKWFLQLGRAVAYLHDHAVVHRDIKPGNLFVEAGQVKLGDYGLSKVTTASQPGQSTNVGTIHYMAPEIAGGAYGKQVDIYACGVVLYEMLTGEVPFRGETWAEIAIKHQTGVPDLSRVPAAYRPILETALDKRAERRFNHMSEFIAAVEALGPSIDRPSVRRELQPTPRPIVVKPTSVRAEKRSRIGDTVMALAAAPFVAVPIAAAYPMLRRGVSWEQVGIFHLLITAVATAVILPSRTGDRFGGAPTRRLVTIVLGAGVGIFAFWLHGWSLPRSLYSTGGLHAGEVSYAGGTIAMEQGGKEFLVALMCYFAAVLGVIRWSAMTQRRRKDRFSLFPVAAAAFWGILMALFWRAEWLGQGQAPPGYLAVTAAAAAIVVQLVSPWSPAPRPKPRRRRLTDPTPSD